MNDEPAMKLPEAAASPLAVAPERRSKRQIKADALASERAAQLRWKGMLAAARAAFAKVPPEDLAKVNGNLHLLAGLIQLRYHTSREDADQRVQRFFAEQAAA